ncbi:XRE family transcriptional regulator [Paenibacillus faecis]|uniref:helix-turn-helix domain-containing protein n=1 Tax=Paenibacillus TaxID=44249 RepID=UPI001B03A025|nr:MULTISPECIES: XRE family transcriptional regulator [Paenibacillus]MCA1295316.1 XRE family transcriptional regulator [Paenibacillus sp. alder61]GIO84833.1 XRE family transcriptional regulator [Paenibacillus faecis]
MELGSKIRKIRKAQNRSLDDIAKACGFTKSLLSKIENGKTVPPIGTLIKIAEALGTKISILLDDQDLNGTVFTTHRMSLDKMVQTDKGYAFSAIAAERPEKWMQPFYFVARKGKTGKRTVSHVGQEFIYVLEGTMIYYVGKEEYTLNAGDSLYFDSVENHKYVLVTDEVKYLSVFCSNSKA